MGIQGLHFGSPIRLPCAIRLPINTGVLLTLMRRIRPFHHQRAIKVDNLIVEPLSFPQAQNILVGHLLPTTLGDDAALAQQGVHGRFVVRWQAFWKGFFPMQTTVDSFVFCTVAET